MSSALVSPRPSRRNRATSASESNVPVRTASASLESQAPKPNAEGQVIAKPVPINLNRIMACVEGGTRPDGSNGNWEAFSVPLRKKFESTIGGMATAIIKWQETKLQIGEKLATLRSECTTGQWDAIRSYVFPALGASAKTVDRWIECSLRSQVLMPNPHFRNVVMMMGDGNSALIHETQEDENGKKRSVIKLSPFFEKAMQQFPIPENAGPAEVEAVARQVVTVANKLRASGRKSSDGTQRKAALAKIGLVISEQTAEMATWTIAETVKLYAAKHGKNKAEELIAMLDAIVEKGDYTPSAGFAVEKNTEAGKFIEQQLVAAHKPKPAQKTDAA